MGSLAVIARVIEESAKVNPPQLCRPEDGKVTVPTYDWKTDYLLSLERCLTLNSTTTFVFRLSNQDQCVRIHADMAGTELSTFQMVHLSIT